LSLPPSAVAGKGGIRGRLRAQVQAEVKAAALRMLASGGPQAISVNAIAKELGVSGPALYRYFASRDELLADLVEDSYRDFYAGLARADAQAPQADAAGRLRALMTAYRTWALGEPHRYRLLFRPPVPGFDAHDERLVLAAQPTMNLLIDALSQSTTTAELALHPGLELQLEEWVARQDRPQVPAAVAQQAISLWAQLHGLVGLEIGGNLGAMGLVPQLFFETEISRLLDQVLSPGRAC